MTVEFKGCCVVVGTVVSDRDLPPDRMTGVAVAGGALADPFNVVSSGPDGVVEPVDVEAMVDVDAEEAADVFEGVEDAAELDVPMFRLADDDEPDGAAHAIPWLVNRAAPTPSATASPPIRPAYASPRTKAFISLTVNRHAGNRKNAAICDVNINLSGQIIFALSKMVRPPSPSQWSCRELTTDDLTSMAP